MLAQQHGNRGAGHHGARRSGAGRHRPSVTARAHAADESRPMPQRATVAIAGAGIAGLAAAVGLHRLGVDVAVLERAPALRQEGSAVALWSNAWRALDALGMGQLLRDDFLLLDRIELVSSRGKLLRQFAFSECDVAGPPTASGHANEMRGVARAQLLQALAGQLPPSALHLGAGVTGVTSGGGAGGGGGPVLQLSNGQQLSCDVCVGADGANSVVAAHLGLPPTNYAGYVAYRGVAQYERGTLPLPPNTIRQMFGCGVRAGMYPMTPQQAYWYICVNAAEGVPRPRDAAACAAEALAAVRGWSWGIEQAVRNTDPAGISRAGIRDRWTAGSFGRGAVTLAGDAAHPMTPNLGQGGCTALEDAVVLARQLAPVLLAQKAQQWGSQATSGPPEGAIAAALRAYEAERSRRCLPLTVRSYAMGAALQIPLTPVVEVRDAFIQHAFRPGHFLDHTGFDAGRLAAVV